MRKTLITTLAASTLMLSGCAAGLGGGLGGYGGGGLGGNPLGGLLGAVLNGGVSGSGYAGQQNGSSEFQRVAVDTCGQQASQYGQVSITDVRQTRGDIMQVDGRVGTNFQQRGFTCSFASNGRIVDFRVG